MLYLDLHTKPLCHAVNLVREAPWRRWLLPGRLVLIQVHILGRPWTNDQIFCRAMKQVSHFNLENTALKRIRTLTQFFCGVRSEKSDLDAAYLTSRVRRKGRSMLSTRLRRQTFSLRSFCFSCVVLMWPVWFCAMVPLRGPWTQKDLAKMN